MDMPKDEALRQFTQILFAHNPMQLDLKGKPQAHLEYDSEALSILARFCEGMLRMFDTDKTLEIGTAIVQSAFEFWFTEKIADDARAEALTKDLLRAFAAMYPTHEQHAETVIKSKL